MWYVYVAGAPVGHSPIRAEADALAALFIGEPDVRYRPLSCEFCPVSGGGCGVCVG